MFTQPQCDLFVKLAKLGAHYGIDSGYAHRGGIATNGVYNGAMHLIRPVMFMMLHDDSNHRKKTAFPPRVTLYDETKLQFGCG